MATSKRAGRWRWAALSAYLALTMILLAITWHFAGYKPCRRHIDIRRQSALPSDPMGPR